MRRARRMLSVALLICIVWNLDHGDINFKSFKKEKINKQDLATVVYGVLTRTSFGTKLCFVVHGVTSSY